MNTRQHITLAALALWSGLTLTACGNDSDNPPPDDPSVEITHRGAPADQTPTSPATPTSQTSTPPATSDTGPAPSSTRSLGPEHDEGFLSQPRHPSAAPTPSGFEWSEPSQHTPSDPQGTPRGAPDLAKLDRQDPEATARAFIQTIWSADTRTDVTDADAVQRATTLATSDYGKTMSSGSGLSGGGEWMAMVKNDGWVTTKVRRSHDTAETPEDSNRTQWSAWVVDVTRHGLPKDRQKSTAVAYVRLTHTPQGWAVEHYELR